MFALCNRPGDESIHSGGGQWSRIGLGKRTPGLSFENVEPELPLTHLSEAIGKNKH